jgi:aromatic-L-amino-acid decarboxylase
VPRDLRASARRDDIPAAIEDYLGRLNQELLTRVQQSGEAFLSNAVVGGRFALRACIVNFRTSDADIDAVVSLVSRLGNDIDKKMRSVPSV